MKLVTIVSKPFVDSFKKLMALPNVPVKTAFKLRGIKKTLSDQTEKYIELKDQYASEFSLKDENGKPIEEIVGTQKTVKLDMSRIHDFYKKMKELNEVDAPIAELSVAELGTEAAALLTPDDVFNLEFLTE